MKATKKRKKASSTVKMADMLDTGFGSVLRMLEIQKLEQKIGHGNVMTFLALVEQNILKHFRMLIAAVGSEEARIRTTSRELSGGKYVTNCVGDILNTRTKELVPPDEPVFLIRAKDRFSMDILRVYHDLCVKAALPVAQLESLAKADAEVRDWRMKHADQVKNPD